MFSHHHGPAHHPDDDDHHDDDDHGHHFFEGRFGLGLRTAFATLILAAAIVAACIVMIPAGEAGVITRFGDPSRVLTRPGLAWKLPVPFETTIPIDLRLRTTSTGLQDVGTQDGLRVLVQAYVAWRVSSDPGHILQFLRSVRNQPDEAARQLRSFVSAALHITASSFGLADLVNIDASKVRLDAFEQQLRAQVADRMLQVYGIEIGEIGIEQLTLPNETLAATVDRMRAERETVAAERTAEGLRRAAKIRSNADRDGREVVAKAREQASQIEADAEQQAARIYSDAYKGDPELYTLIRSLDTINKVVGRNTSILLRTDAAPFRVLVDGPPGAPPAQGSASPPLAKPQK
jgi:modulator of FtsH protease HflC